MIRTVARWEVARPPDHASVSALADALKLPEALARLLLVRGFATPDAAKAFLRPELATLSDPFSLKDMDRAVETIAGAVRAGRRILVHGDYDVDGQCATTLLTRVLRAASADVVPFVPQRMRDGYDFGPAGLAAAKHHGASLIVTADCGVTALDAVDKARAEGIDVVVTDHHMPGTLPAANALLNPRRPDCTSGLKELCGTGVVFKLAQALAGTLGLPETLPFHFLDLVALATVADVVPLRGENRVLVRHGLKLLGDSRWPGVRALVKSAGLEGQSIRGGQVGFILAPRLNAVGRIGDAMDGVTLLLSDNPADAERRAAELEAINTRRQQIDQAILDEAVAAVEATVDVSMEHAIVLAKDGWHPGVIGIVASRLVERYARPAIMIGLEGDEGRGSGRSIAGFDLHAALTACAGHLVRYGGHPMAAGLTVKRDALPAFRAAFSQVARERLAPEDLVPTQRVDALLPLARIDEDLERLLRHLEPCGPGNPAPVFGVQGARARWAKPVGADHVRFTIDDGTSTLSAIGFGWAGRLPADWAATPVDVAFKVEMNEYRGSASLQARVVQIRPAA
jgi:single-stranded-DNA-specific exonuclease